MKRRRVIAMFFSILSSIVYVYSSQIAPHSITFFVQPLPPKLIPEQQKKQQNKAQKYSKQPEKLARALIKRELHPEQLNRGIYVTYLGYMTHSNSFGQVTLPRRTAQDTLHVLVTQDLTPVPRTTTQPTTLLGFVVDPNARASYYRYYLKQNPETDLLTWYVIEEIVPSGIIPAQALIIFEDPEHIIIPVGTTSTFSRENLVLPPIYITPTAQPARNALRFLKLRKFFSAVAFSYTSIPNGYQQQLR